MNERGCADTAANLFYFYGSLLMAGNEEKFGGKMKRKPKGSGWILVVVGMAIVVGLKIVAKLDVGDSEEESFKEREERFKVITNLDPVAKVEYLAGRVPEARWYLARLAPEERSYLKTRIFFARSYTLAAITHDAMKTRVIPPEEAEWFERAVLIEKFAGTILVHGTLTFTQDNRFSMSISRPGHGTAERSGSWKAIGGELTLSTAPGSHFGGTYSYSFEGDMLRLRIREAVMPEMLSGGPPASTEKGITTLLWDPIRHY